MTDWDAFSPEDFELLVKVIGLYPDLDMVAYAGKLARDRIEYPLRCHDDLLPLFSMDPKSTVEFRGHTVSFEQAVKYLPKEFFPIEDEEQFLSRTLIAFGIQQQESADSKCKLFVDPGFTAVADCGASESKKGGM